MEVMKPEQFERLGGLEKIDARKKMLEARKRAFMGSNFNDIEKAEIE